MQSMTPANSVTVNAYGVLLRTEQKYEQLLASSAKNHTRFQKLHGVNTFQSPVGMLIARLQTFALMHGNKTCRCAKILSKIVKPWLIFFHTFDTLRLIRVMFKNQFRQTWREQRDTTDAFVLRVLIIVSQPQIPYVARREGNYRKNASRNNAQGFWLAHCCDKRHRGKSSTDATTWEVTRGLET